MIYLRIIINSLIFCNYSVCIPWDFHGSDWHIVNLLSLLTYRTLHSYNSIWAVWPLFPQQRWRMHTYLVSGNHWPREPCDLHKTTSTHKFRSTFGATSKTCIFYKYVVFKHSFSLFTQFLCSSNTLRPVWLNRRQIATTWMDLTDIHIHRLRDFFQSQRNRPFPTIKRKTF